jgi:anion-transporting  ArsA/GET3 family ATPase
VGKTTTAAAIGLLGAAAGKRTLCLTIDPARRLAESLGYPEMTSEARRVDPERLAAAGQGGKGELTVMMLDTKGTFDDLIARYASSPEVRDRILSNKLDRQISTSLAGTQEYMAMEKLYAIKQDPSWDLIVVDTPPTTNALDFLDAPERMIGAIDSPFFRWLATAFQSSGRLSVSLLARGAAAALRGMSRLTGQGFLEALAELVILINELFGGFRARADEVRKGLRAGDVAYVLVTSPDPLSIREILYFGERLRQQGMRSDAVVVNRVHPARDAPPSASAVLDELGSLSISLGKQGAERVIAAFGDEAKQGGLDRTRLAALAAFDGAGGPIRIEIPAFADDVHDLAALGRVARFLKSTARS